ncbi:MAG: tetratricopeptide repeat protein, partial [Desulfobulbaceae bacterium]|nr:tetratricopeptide repeat protein [Desulfobulbaceae bacterium]
DGFVRDSLGWVLFKMGRLDEALAELQKALEIEGDDPAINEHIGDVYYRLGKVKKARSAWGKALVLQKDDKKKSLLRKKIEAAGK